MRKKSSKYIGVSWDKATKKWRVQIQFNKKHFYLGCFDDPEIAAEKYDEAAILYYGYETRLNRYLKECNINNGRILLSKGKFTIVDKEDYERVSQFIWSSSQHPTRINLCYVVRKIKDKNTGKISMQYLHSFILNSKEQIDHKDGNGLNNRKNNLRFATRSQNNMNQTLASHNKSGYKGVSWDKRKRRWRASITLNSKNNYIGTFENKIEAAKSYNEKAKQLFGEFARLNNIEG